jgi:hypothetical protein
VVTKIKWGSKPEQQGIIQIAPVSHLAWQARGGRKEAGERASKQAAPSTKQEADQKKI